MYETHGTEQVYQPMEKLLHNITDSHLRFFQAAPCPAQREQLMHNLQLIAALRQTLQTYQLTITSNLPEATAENSQPLSPKGPQ